MTFNNSLKQSRNLDMRSRFTLQTFYLVTFRPPKKVNSRNMFNNCPSIVSGTVNLLFILNDSQSIKPFASFKRTAKLTDSHSFVFVSSSINYHLSFVQTRSSKKVLKIEMKYWYLRANNSLGYIQFQSMLV